MAHGRRQDEDMRTGQEFYSICFSNSPPLPLCSNISTWKWKNFCAHLDLHSLPPLAYFGFQDSYSKLPQSDSSVFALQSATEPHSPATLPLWTRLFSIGDNLAIPLISAKGGDGTQSDSVRSSGIVCLFYWFMTFSLVHCEAYPGNWNISAFHHSSSHLSYILYWGGGRRNELFVILMEKLLLAPQCLEYGLSITSK